MQFIGLILITAAALALIMLISIWQINKAAYMIIGKKHQDIEYIVNTGKVPEPWTKRSERKAAGLKKKTGNEERLPEFAQKVHKVYLQKLDKLIEYAEKTTLVDGDETRQLLVERLKNVRKEWVDKYETKI